MDFEAKNIMWMTGKSVYEATFVGAEYGPDTNQ
jgi:hypothetical protein